MKITVRTLTGKNIPVEIEPSDSVLQVKEKVCAAGAALSITLPAESQKLIFEGTVLNNDAAVDTVGIKEGGFMVVMATKAPGAKSSPKPAAATSSPASSGTAAPSQPPASSTSTQEPPAAAAPASGTDAPAAGGAQDGGSALVTGSEYDSTVRQLCDMGFEEEQVKRALQAAFNNPERAVEYLFNGIPQQSGGSAAPPASHGSDDSAPEAGERAMDVGSVLRSIPGFNRMKLAVQQNPELLQPILQQIQQVNPDFYALIQTHREAFMQALLEPISEEDLADAEMDDFPDEGGPENPAPGTVYLTAEEVNAVDRLTALGFPKPIALEAYLACDKDENVAANYLFENGAELMDELADATREASARGQDGNPPAGGAGGDNSGAAE